MQWIISARAAMGQVIGWSTPNNRMPQLPEDELGTNLGTGTLSIDRYGYVLILGIKMKLVANCLTSMCKFGAGNVKRL